MNRIDPESFETGRRVYTDDRFPDVEVVNEGGPHFLVFERGRGGVYEPIDDFKGFEQPGMAQVSESFAQRRAKAYFNYLSESNIPEVMDYEDEEKPEHPTTEDVDDIIARARAEADPEKAAELKQQALRQMSFESVAEQLVEHWLRQ